MVGSTDAETTKCADKNSYLLSKLSEDKSGTEDVTLHKYYLFYSIIWGVSSLRILQNFNKDDL